MNELLFLSHRIPYPPNKGDKLRSFNLLKQLSRNYRVHVAAFVDDDDDWRYVDSLKELVGECYFARLSSWRARLRSLPAIWGNTPLSLPYYRDAALQAWINRLLSERPVKQVIIFSGAMAQYLENPAYLHLRRIIDFVDVDSDKWEQYAKSKSWPMSWIYHREARTLLAYERKIAAVMDACVFVSSSEAALFKRLAPEVAYRVWDIHNGVDVDYFDPDKDYPVPYDGAQQPIVFTGAMDYWANVDAVTWFVRDIFPNVRMHVPTAHFYIVGARPSSAVQQLAKTAGITVTGSVKDIRPYIAHARVVVAPLRIARGVQNKVLEAMAMAKPVVVTPQALDGIRCHEEKEVIIAGDASNFADRVCSALQNNIVNRLEAARQRVVSDYSWEDNLQRFETLLQGLPLSDTEEKNDPASSSTNSNILSYPRGGAAG